MGGEDDSKKRWKSSYMRKAAGLVVFVAVATVLYWLLAQHLPLSEGDGLALLEIAHAEIAGEEYKGPLPAKIHRKRPVFVSLYKNGTRVNCLGHTGSFFPLYQSVKYLSSSMKVENGSYGLAVTIFHDYEKVENLNGIAEGYGVLVRKDGKEGVVLPQSFREYNLTDEEALKLAAMKAGFERFSWDEFEVYKYRADVYRGEYH